MQAEKIKDYLISINTCMTNELFGVHYFNTQTPTIYESDTNQLYYYKTYIGTHEIEVERGDSVYYFDIELEHALVKSGPCTIRSHHLATVIRGYMHPNAMCALKGVTTLPYINGCSTKQLFAPLRLGDPTLQYLNIPPFSKEQNHHIHSTARVVYILKGHGKSIVGVEQKNIETELKPGMVCVFEPMSPHHFETDTADPLIVVPLHIFSSVGALEKNHPMFNGTVII